MKKYLFLFSLIITILFAACSNSKYDNLPLNIIPVPQKLEQHNGAFVLDGKTSISYSNKISKSKDAIENFAENLRLVSAFELAVIENKMGKNTIHIDIDETISVNSEAYQLVVNSSSVSLIGQSDAGVFVGLQTLRQLLPNQIEAKEQSNIAWVIPNVNIYDEPRFSWRGMHLDVSRHFFSKDFVKRLSTNWLCIK